jgi:diguanylate cyclase (GGDEF)-like protein
MGPDHDVAVFFLDLDRFKVVNDSLGHTAGDRILVELARRLQAAVRPGDLVARFGGDEFVVACSGVASAAHALEVADRLLDLVEQPLISGGAHLVITASIGIVLTAGGADAQSLLRDADAAMYEAKDRGRAQAVLFDNELRTKVVSRLDIERGLRLALERGELEVAYQPKVRLEDTSLAGFEALLRWRHPERGYLLPEAFLEVAEETGLVRSIGEWVFERACQQLVSWRTHHPEWGAIRMCVNLSVHQLADRAHSARTAAILARTGVPADGIVVEITESVLAHDVVLVQRSLAELHELGVSLALDDFGTGYSSMVHLKKFPIDTLKIDISFIAGMMHDPEDAAIVESIVSLAHALGLELIAEGVESEEQAERLRALGVGVAQGFRWSPALAPAEIEALLLSSASPIRLPGRAATVARR